MGGDFRGGKRHRREVRTHPRRRRTRSSNPQPLRDPDLTPPAPISHPGIALNFAPDRDDRMALTCAAVVATAV